ncbi:DUF4340 domain-containing protein [Oscillospiraceae bacterium OttesenSCG-928-F05]|nr:DUF4340 domain-containing protein [Oscillospiraceae bacterium OttesenSCG-928-F05]
MQKSLKPLIITGAIIAALAALLLILNFALPEEQTVDPSASPSPGSSEETIYVISEQYYNLVRMEVAYRDQQNFENYSFDIKTNEDYSRSFKFTPTKFGWQYNDEAMRTTAFAFITLPAIAVVEENVTDLGQYGLAKPEYTVKGSFADEADASKTWEIELAIGDKTPISDAYYVALKGDSTVYAINKNLISALQYQEFQYRSMQFFPTYEKPEEEIVYFRLEKPDGTVIEIESQSEEDLENLPIGATQFHMLQPLDSGCNDINVQEKLLAPAGSINISGIAQDGPTEAQLTEYGFDDPMILEIRDRSGNSVTYRIGTVDRGAAYIMANNVDSILYTMDINSSIFETSHVSLMFKLPWTFEIVNVKSIRLELQSGADYYLTFEHGEDQYLLAELEGKVVDTTNARRIFMHMMNMMIVDALEEPFTPRTGQKAEYTFTVTQLDGAKRTLELYQLNDRQYAVSVDGEEPQFYVHKRSTTALEEAFEILEAGGEVPKIN